MEHASPGNGLRLGGDLLAAAAVLATPGVWKKLLQAMLQKIEDRRGIDWSKVVLDSQSVRAVFGGR